MRGGRIFFFLRQYGYGHCHPDNGVSKGMAYVQAGCGIVYDSFPKHEYEESMNKARALLRALEQAGGNQYEVREKGKTGGKMRVY